MSIAHILVAEDDAVLRSLYVKKFTLAGYEVTEAEDGERALQKAVEHAPDLMLADIHMPKLDGFEILRRLPKAQRAFPIIMLTNFGQDEFKLKGQELGADDYFVKKDMTIKSLLEMVEKHLKMKKA